MVDHYNANRITGVWLLIAIIIVALPSLVFARATNVNEVNTLFEDHIENKAEYFRNLEGLRDESAGRIESKSGLASIGEIDKAEGFSSQINSIDEYDLGAEGKKIRASEEYRFYDEHEMAPDWSKPGNRMHKEDAEDITLAVAKKLKALAKHLEELGLDFDCSKQRKPVQLDPAFSLEITRNLKENVEFDQILCEEARNKYRCTNLLHLTCKRKSPGGSLPGTIRISVSEMPDHWWLGRGNDGNMSYGYHTTNMFLVFNTEVMEEVKAKIIEKIGPVEIEVPAQRIMIFGGEQVLYQLNEYGEYGTVQNTWHPNPEGISGSIRFFYKAPNEAKCEEWEEDWAERCVLK